MARQELAAKMEANPADMLVSVVDLIFKDREGAAEMAAAIVAVADQRQPHADDELEAGISKVLEGLAAFADWSRNYDVALRNRPGFKALSDGRRAIKDRLKELSTPALSHNAEARHLVVRVGGRGDMALSAKDLAELTALRHVVPEAPFGPDYPLLDEVLNGFIAELKSASPNLAELEEAAQLMKRPADLKDVSPKERKAWANLRGLLIMAVDTAENEFSVSATPARHFAIVIRAQSAVDKYRAAVNETSLDAGAGLGL